MGLMCIFYFIVFYLTFLYVFKYFKHFYHFLHVAYLTFYSEIFIIANVVHDCFILCTALWDMLRDIGCNEPWLDFRLICAGSGNRSHDEEAGPPPA